ncbi:bifunctional acetate--CoA ligase family protein/GNAT family N-acetyltransferase [Maricaulis sp.]|uniref:bifunctional acetate--CoA ligase family protein/GNAT family N-acetyltransferase n=1 Tax=Maricaulis sp. TaxID=1486257 RepID=UPI0025C289C5|nr:bifunctional acetate--CoA ligase family protein/GNAT family N-acetyltransferase [Maricaulis sp.]
MSIRNLDALLRPQSVALIGASNRPGSIGEVAARNLFRSGFPGLIMPVNPKHRSIAGVLAYPDIASLPETPDLAVICTPPDTVPEIIAELGARGTRAAVIVTAGFGEGGHEAGLARRQAVLDAARPHLMRIVGPNCLGVVAPPAGLNASFCHLMPGSGGLAFATQSGAIVTSVVDWAAARDIGFSHLVSLGDMIDVDFGDMLDYLGRDPGTNAILLYVEAITSARKFMSAARAAARMKPVIVVKAGRHAEGAAAAASHTGALAGEDAVYDAVFRRAGLLRVYSLEDLFHAASILASRQRPAGDRLAILSNGGGIGVLATDALIDEGGSLAPLDAATRQRLDGVLPPTWSHGNPVDIIGDADGPRYAAALEALLESDSNDAVLVLNCPTGVTSSLAAAESVIDTVTRAAPDKPVLTSWVGEKTACAARTRFAASRLTDFATPEEAVKAFMFLVEDQRAREALMETPPAQPGDIRPDRDGAAAILSTAIREGREWLSEPEAKSVMDAYGIPVSPTAVARTPADAAARAEEFATPVALKILSREITHKSDVGGVALNLTGADAVAAAAQTMLDRVARHRPGARIDGFTVQPMIERPGAHELILGFKEDAQFGPVVLFGQGGVSVEVVADRAIGLPPLNMKLARELIGRTRVARLLRGYRDRPAADLDSIAISLIRIAQLAADHPQIVELDINPLLADAAGVIALDARIRVADRAGSGLDRLAIRPYPAELETPVDLEGIGPAMLRPVRPEDEPAFHGAFARLAEEETQLRLFGPVAISGHAAAARFTQIDYDREMSLVLAEPGPAGKAALYGIVRMSADPDGERAEFTLIVRPDKAGAGIGTCLMTHLIACARNRGIGELFGLVPASNAAMLTLAQNLGFHAEPVADHRGLTRLFLRLRQT